MTQLTFLFAEDIQPPASRQVRSNIRLGDAAEKFVIAKLLKAGFEANEARRDAPYDIVVDFGKGRYCRVQVKGHERAHDGKWHFRFVRGNPRTGAGAYAYTATDFDISACVALSLERVAFFPGVHVSIPVEDGRLPAPGQRDRELETLPQRFQSPALNLQLRDAKPHSHYQT